MMKSSKTMDGNKIGMGLSVNNYIGTKNLKKIFNNTPFKLEIKNIDVNGQKRGCSGFVTNIETHKVCYITTEPFFNHAAGSGLFDNQEKAVMMSCAKNNKDYSGGINQWISIQDIVPMAYRLTSA